MVLARGRGFLLRFVRRRRLAIGVGLALPYVLLAFSPGARRFLYNIVQYPGCGSFFRAASHVAFDLDHVRLID